jgi:Fur family peroxide stress response transcriptional regulator
MSASKLNELQSSPPEPHTDLRLTPQRREVLDILLEKRDHPTATEVFMQAKTRMPSISLATVYNCLEALTHAGYVRQVNMDRAPSRYCPNLKDHAHFYCDSCGNISDVELQAGLQMRELLVIPTESVVSKCDIILHGRCPECTRKTN